MFNSSPSTLDYCRFNRDIQPLFIYPLSFLIKFFADAFHGNYGLSIVLMTFIIRLAIMPLMMNQTKKQMDMKEKMTVLQPELTALQDKYKDDVSADAKRQQQAEMMQLYQKHQFNPLSMGCLPMLLQWPITLAFLLCHSPYPGDCRSRFFCGLAWGRLI
ncbi:membrane protein insertase YidC [Paenibacillus rhizoplanae]